MNDSALVLSAVLVPTLGSLLLPLGARVSEQFRNLLAALMVGMAFACSVALIPGALAGQTVTAPLFAGLVLRADALAVFVASVSSFISLVIVIYSFDYISHYEYRNEYYLMVVMFLGSMMGLVYAGNLIPLFVFWELTAITSWRLIGFFRDPEYVLKADKAFLMTGFGALLMLLGFVALYQQTGSFDLLVIKERLQDDPVSDVAMVLILFGILSKSATLPFHSWLPDAGVAPSPVTALLHAAVLVKIGVYAFARLFVATMGYSEFGHTLVLVIVAASALVSASAALTDTNMKRIIAYSTVSQIAFIFLGLAAGTEYGVAGALLYILMHGLAKGGLFLCAGIVEQKTHKKDITQMGGLIKTMPVTAISFLLCALSVMGTPPFGGFFSKLMVMTGALQAGHMAITLVFLFGAFMTIIYLFRIFNLMFMGEPRFATPEGGLPKEGSRWMVTSVATLAFLSVVGGVAINWPAGLAEFAAQQMLGVLR
jgi:proton-translocating NADH-quinone oxidoreductase chain N